MGQPGMFTTATSKMTKKMNLVHFGTVRAKKCTMATGWMGADMARAPLII